MAIYSEQSGVPFMKVLTQSGFAVIVSLVRDFTQAMDFLFYAIAVYEGYRFSFDR